MILFPLLFSSARLALAMVCAQQALGDWTVQDVVLPVAPDLQSEAAWSVATPLGDSDSDGRSDYVLGGSVHWPTGHSPSSWEQFRILQGMGRAPLRQGPLDPNGLFDVLGGYWLPRTAILQSPLGQRLAVYKNAGSGFVILDAVNNSFLGSIQEPPPPPGQPSITFWDGIHWAGDVNHDGFDDMFLEASAGTRQTRILGMVDGASLQIIWRHYDPDGASNYMPTILGSNEAPGDLNGDGSPDFISTYTQYHATTGRFEAVQIALNGADGTTIWENRFLDGITEGGNLGYRDVSGDGIQDFFLNRGDQLGNKMLQMTDGATGQALWSNSGDFLDWKFQPGFYEYYFVTPAAFISSTGNRARTEIILFTKVRDSITQEDTFGIAQLDASSGAFLSWKELPSSQAPWFLDPFLQPSSALDFFWPLGDIDRDGHQEIFHGSETPTLDNPLVFGLPWSGIILSPSTLAAPTTISPGSNLTIDISVPSSPGRAFTVLFSTVFDHDGGLRFGHWHTNLGASALRTWSVANAANLFSNALNAQGEGSITLAIPNDPRFLGTTIYSRAIIHGMVGEDPLYSMSTPGVTLIQ